MLTQMPRGAKYSSKVTVRFSAIARAYSIWKVEPTASGNAVQATWPISFSRLPEQPLRLVVHEGEPPVQVHGEERIRDAVERRGEPLGQPARLLRRLLAVGDVLDRPLDAADDARAHPAPPRRWSAPRPAGPWA